MSDIARSHSRRTTGRTRWTESQPLPAPPRPRSRTAPPRRRKPEDQSRFIFHLPSSVAFLEPNDLIPPSPHRNEIDRALHQRLDAIQIRARFRRELLEFPRVRRRLLPAVEP